MATVRMADGSTYEVKTLLSDGDSNTKLRKSNDKSVEYLTVGLSLSPAKESGYEMCASRSPGCTQACLFTAGMGVYANVKSARIAKTRLFHQNRDTFKSMLFSELFKWNKKASKQGKQLACRLNVVSDVQWEKVVSRKMHDDSFPANYHLTFSRSETNDNDVQFLMENNCPINIAVVFDHKLFPANYASRKVINGDETDLRFLDESGTIVGLYAKGRGKKDTSGFVIHTLGLINRS
jgi:hypothetical protein